MHYAGVLNWTSRAQFITANIGWKLPCLSESDKLWIDGWVVYSCPIKLRFQARKSSAVISTRRVIHWNVTSWQLFRRPSCSAVYHDGGLKIWLEKMFGQHFLLADLLRSDATWPRPSTTEISALCEYVCY